VAINDVLPLKAARRCTTANVKCFWGSRDSSDLISIIAFTFAMWRHFIRLAAAPFTSFRLANFGWVGLRLLTSVCKPDKEAEHRTDRIHGECAKTPVLL